jgi:hypothetical protein
MEQIEIWPNLEMGIHQVTHGGLAWARPLNKEQTKWDLVKTSYGCRGYIIDYRAEPILGRKSILPFEEVHLFYGTSQAITSKKMEKSFQILNEIEKRIGLTPTKVLQCSDKCFTGYLFIGDKAWNTCLWKLQLYTYYLKKYTFGTTEYDHALKVKIGYKTAEELYWANIKENNKEKLLTFYQGFKTATYSQTHVYSGFVSISNGSNKYMQDLLFFGIDADAPKEEPETAKVKVVKTRVKKDPWEKYYAAVTAYKI